MKASLLEGKDIARLGMTATVHLPPAKASQPAVPLAAVFQPQNDPTRMRVWIVDERTKTVKSIPVTLGVPLGNQQIAVSGLVPGQMVVSAGVTRLAEGQAVKILGEEKAQALARIHAALEESATAQKSILVWIPLVVIVTLVLLMIQLQSISRTLLVFITAPLGVIGAGFALHLFRMPFGFVALLGVIALAGMIMRNSVILVDQIEQDEKAGRNTRTAIVESTVRRFRPIMLTAAAAILAMIPLSRSDFFGPQAVAIMGGLTIATVLTILFVPARSTQPGSA